ncbi:MAG TPA: DUF120 domain-containing protein [Nitrososphaerales archaeon]
MNNIKPMYLTTLVELIKVGAIDNYVEVSTNELAKLLNQSQQSASKHLLDLEASGYVDRIRVQGRNRVKITAKGLECMMDFYSSLKRVFEKEDQIHKISGEVFTGLGEGAYYMSLRGYRRQFVKHLGFDPYPGTLNIRLDTESDRRVKRDLIRYSGIKIDGFEDGQRTYGWAKCYHARINGKIDGVIVLLERTHHDESVMELVAPINIREKLNLKDRDKITVEVGAFRKKL